MESKSSKVTMPSDLPDPKPPINHSYMQNQLAIDAVPLNKNVVYNFKFAAFRFDWPNQKNDISLHIKQHQRF